MKYKIVPMTTCNMCCCRLPREDICYFPAAEDAGSELYWLCPECAIEQFGDDEEDKK